MTLSSAFRLGLQSALIFLTFVLLAGLPVHPAFAEGFLVKSGSAVNARNTPGSNSKVVGKLQPGTRLEGLETRDGWIRFEIAPGKQAWVAERLLTKDPRKAVRSFEITPQIGHAGQVFDVRFSNSGEMVATSGAEDGIRLWSTKSGRFMRLFVTGYGVLGASQIGFSPDDRTLYTSNDEGGLTAFSIGTGLVLWKVRQESKIRALAVSPSGDFLAVATDEGVSLLDSKGALVRPLFKDSLDHLVFLNEQQLLAASIGHPYHIVSTADGAVIAKGSFLNDPTCHETGMLTGVAVSRDGTRIATSALDGNICVWQMPQRALVKQFKTDGGEAQGVAISPDGSRVVAAVADGTSVVWDVDGDKPPVPLSGHSDRAWAVAFSPDGQQLASVADSRDGKIWDATNGLMIHSLETEVAAGGRASFSDDDASLLITSEAASAMLWDAKTLALKGEIEGGSIDVYDEKWSPDGTLLTGKGGNRLRVFDLVNRQLRVLAEGLDNGKEYTETIQATSPTWSHAAIGVTDGQSILVDIAKGTQHPLTERSDKGTGSIAFAPDGKTMMLGSKGVLKRFDVETRQLLQEKQIADIYLRHFTYSADGQTVFMAGKTSALAVNARDLSVKWVVPYPAETDALIQQIKVQDDLGRIIVVTMNALYVYQTSDGALLQYIVGQTFLSRNVEFASVVAGQTLTIYRTSDFKTVATRDGVDGYDDVRPDNSGKPFLLEFYRKHRGELGGGNFYSMGVSADEKHVVLSTRDGVSRLFDIGRDIEIARFMSFPDGEWAVVTPDGFFNTSPNGAKRLNLVRGTDVISIDQVYNALYRPDLVAEALAGDPQGKVREAAAKLDLDKILATGLPPRIKIVSPAAPQGPVQSDSAEIEVELTDAGGGFGRVEWRRNGVLQKVTGEVAGTAQGPNRRESLKITLVPGPNVISIAAYNSANLIVSDPANYIVEVAAAAPAAPGDVAPKGERPRLFVLSIGVDDYADSRLKLGFAVADANSITAAFKSAAGNLYSSVETLSVADARATRAGIQAAFDDLSARVKPVDVFVFYLAGHGKTLDGRYFFIPQDFIYDGDASVVASGIGQEQWATWFAMIKAEKSVLLYDTCESGSMTMQAAARGLESVSAFDRFSKATGRTTLTASTDTQPALEGYKNHGLFTYSLLDGFANADGDGDGLIEVTELGLHVERVLPALSENQFNFRQQPRLAIIGNSFPLAAPTQVLDGDNAPIIPKKPTHVVISAAAVLKAPNGSQIEAAPLAVGTLVRLLELKDGWALVARDGAQLGYVAENQIVAAQ